MKRFRGLIQAALALSVVIHVPMAQAQTWQKTMQDRYGVQRARVSERVIDNQAVAHGAFFLRGFQQASSIGSQKLSASEATNQEPAIDAASGFIRDNADLFNINHPDQLALERMDQDRFGNYHLRYHRLESGYRLKNMQVMIHLNRQLGITSVNGEINAVSEGLKEYLAQKASSPKRSRLTDEGLLNVVAQQLGRGTAGLAVQKAQLLAQNDQPYLYWQLHVIDLHDGERSFWRIADQDGSVLHKRDGLAHDHRRHSPGVQANHGGDQ